jgi:hypothetical protein
VGSEEGRKRERRRGKRDIGRWEGRGRKGSGKGEKERKWERKENGERKDLVKTGEAKMVEELRKEANRKERKGKEWKIKG